MSAAGDAGAAAGLSGTLEGILARIRDGDNDGALARCEDAARRYPEAFDPPHLAGYLHQLKGDHEGALRWFTRASRQGPDNADLLNNTAASLRALGRFAEAEQCYRRAIRADPGNALAHYNFGDLLLMEERPAEALARARSAAEAMPELAAAHRLMGLALQAQGRRDEAVAAFRASAVNDYERAQARFCEALAQLHHGDYAAGWELYEARLDYREMRCLHEQLDYPRWRGASLAGRTVLVAREQGIGDEIMFASCLPDLRAVAGRCIVTCDRRLRPLFERAFPGTSFVSGSEAEIRAQLAGERIDWQVPAGSLPFVFRPSLKDFPPRAAYLAADPARVEHWRARLATLGGGSKIGLSWRGGGMRTGGQRRSIPLEALGPVLEHPNAHWISLQHEARAADEVARLAAARPDLRIHHWPEVLASYDETAALLAALDQTISVCGSIIHLCGALGLPGWVMVPWFAEWRYGDSGESMPWYPSLRLYRQPAYGDWQPVLERVRRELAARLPA